MSKVIVCDENYFSLIFRKESIETSYSFRPYVNIHPCFFICIMIHKDLTFLKQRGFWNLPVTNGISFSEVFLSLLFFPPMHFSFLKVRTLSEKTRKNSPHSATLNMLQWLYCFKISSSRDFFQLLKMVSSTSPASPHTVLKIKSFLNLNLSIHPLLVTELCSPNLAAICRAFFFRTKHDIGTFCALANFIHWP